MIQLVLSFSYLSHVLILISRTLLQNVLTKRDRNPAPRFEQSTSTSNLLLIDNSLDDGLAQLQKYKEFADALCQMNSKLL